MKHQIIEELGQTAILLPSLIAEGLAANDHIKVRMSALQAAVQRARHPGKPATNLEAECHASGLAPAGITALINGAHMVDDGHVCAPNLSGLMTDILGDARTMLRAVDAGDPAQAKLMNGRLDAISAAGLLEPSDTVEEARVAKLTGVSQGGDSLHGLVMDLHKALNRLAATCAEEVWSGAHVFGVHPEDRPAVESFMAGVEQTRPLKFDHPGLDTIATRSGERLLIQNDIGTTDAHVVVVTVVKNAVTVTYTDIRRARAKFFTGCLDKFPVKWSGLDHRTADGLGEESGFYLVTGRCEAGSHDGRDAFLSAVGASLVFLIDWNKARKVLRNLVAKNDAVAILAWAARHRVGHRAFLELGGDGLISSVVRNAAPTRIGFGERLDHALGRSAAIDFLKNAFRASTEALRSGQSVRLVRDQIEADLVRHLERVDSTLLVSVIRQAGLAHDIIAAVAHQLAALQAGRSIDGKYLAGRAGRIEHKADRVAVEARGEVARLNARPLIGQLVERLEETIDDLEQAAFIASLAPSGVDSTMFKTLSGLCGVAIAATEAVASGVAATAEIPNGRRIDADDALAAVERLIEFEHAADALERDMTARVLSGGVDTAPSLFGLELARAIERATDRLAGFGHLLRQHVLADLSA